MVVSYVSPENTHSFEEIRNSAIQIQRERIQQSNYAQYGGHFTAKGRIITQPTDGQMIPTSFCYWRPDLPTPNLHNL